MFNDLFHLTDDGKVVHRERVFDPLDRWQLQQLVDTACELDVPSREFSSTADLSKDLLRQLADLALERYWRYKELARQDPESEVLNVLVEDWGDITSAIFDDLDENLPNWTPPEEDDLDVSLYDWRD